MFYNIILCFYTKQKRLELIIDSISNIDKLEIKWLHIGDTRNKDYWDYLNDLALSKFSKNQNISFSFLGYKSNQDIIKFYKNNSIDIFINLSTSEGIPISMMEAFSFGVPIVATDVGGVSELVNNRVNGFLLDPDPSTSQVKNALIEYANKNDEEKRNFKNNAKLHKRIYLNPKEIIQCLVKN